MRLALRRFARAELAFSRVRTRSVKRVISWAIRSVPLASCFTAEKIVVGELPWCLAILFCTNTDCETASAGLCGVWETHGSASERGGPVGVGVCSLISSFEMTACGLKGTRPAPRKPAWMFAIVIVLKWSGIPHSVYQEARWCLPWRIKYGGTTKPSLLMHSIAVAHSRLP